jgi:methylase of polypeptide subunit release factors
VLPSTTETPPSLLSVSYDSIRVGYTPDLAGGGNEFGQAYLPFVRDHLTSATSVFEWCSGPGFIGFSLLAAGLCDTLDLGDVNPAAGAVVADTVRRNQLDDRVRFHLSDCFTQISPQLRWDLIVGNPPHTNAAAPASAYQHHHAPLIWQDENWDIHRRFYTQAKDRLRPGGAILIQENHRFSEPDDFAEMIASAGLEVVGVHECGPAFEDYFFLWSALPGDVTR